MQMLEPEFIVAYSQQIITSHHGFLPACERRVLAEAARLHSQDRILVNQNRTVVF